MINDEKIKIKIGTKNYKHYLNKGYNVYENGKFVNGKEIIINSIDISPTSKVKISCTCDLCGKVFFRYPYNRDFNNNKDYCNSCSHKISDLIKENHEILITETYNAVNEYIKENKTIAGFVSNNKYGYRIKTLHLNLREICESLGYSWFDVGVNRNSYAFNNKNELIDFIKKVIEIEGYFPTCTQLSNYGIWPRTYLAFFSSYDEIKKEMGYIDSLTDNSGYQCKSVYEMMFANYLIENGIKFKRELKPFKNNNYRCDFVLYDKSNNPIYIEIWGLLKDVPKGYIEKKYKETYETKLLLYKENHLNLKSFFIKDFKTINIFKKKFLTIFKDIDLNIDYDNLDYSITRYYHIKDIDKLIEEEFKELEYFPTAEEFRIKHMTGVLNSIYKHYGSIKTVAHLLNKLTKQEWKRTKA